MPSFAARCGARRYDESAHGNLDRELAQGAGGSAGFVEGNRDISQPRRDHGPALGEAGGRCPFTATSTTGWAPSTRSGRSWTPGCAAASFSASPESAASPVAHRADGRCDRRPRHPQQRLSWDWRRLGWCDWRQRVASSDRVLLAESHRRRAIPESHRLRWRRAGRRGVARRSRRRVSLGP